MTPGKCVVEVLRGEIVESAHRVNVAVAHAGQGLAASAGNPAHHSFVRSAIKMFQVLPFVEGGGVDRFQLSGEELALCTASHGGEPFHIATVRAILAKVGLTEAALACGPHLPLHEPSAAAIVAAGQPPGRIHNNCSGKHAGMLAHCVQQQWVTDGYHRASHPMQQRIISTLTRWMRIDASELAHAIDGCGLPTFAVALRGCSRRSAPRVPIAPVFLAAHRGRVESRGRFQAGRRARVAGGVTTHRRDQRLGARPPCEILHA